MTPLDVLDYCSQDCQRVETVVVTVWDDETCTCCGGSWGGDGSGTCRGKHVVSGKGSSSGDAA